jgi:queuine tRNA-ribosyltransferase
MSLSKLNKIDREKGAIFKSHVDGKQFILSPEESIRIQKGLNSDIVMVMDECPKKTTDQIVIAKSLELSTYWAQRSKKAFGQNSQKALFGIVQGGLFDNLRKKSINDLTKIGFDGYAIGGLAVGETQKQMFKVLDDIAPYMPKNKPRYLMGVGTPSDILGAVKNGVDMFDCVLPTRSGRTGLAFTWDGRLNLRNSKYKKDNTPISKSMKTRNLNAYSKSYINHLISSNEILASMILTLNNIVFYQELMKNIRYSIKNNTFDIFYKKYINVI